MMKTCLALKCAKCQNSFNPRISYVPFSGRIVDMFMELFIPLWISWKFVACRSTTFVLLFEVHCPRRILRLQCSDVHRKWLVHPSESKKSYAFFRIQTCTLRYLLWSRETSEVIIGYSGQKFYIALSTVEFFLYLILWHNWNRMYLGVLLITIVIIVALLSFNVRSPLEL